MTQVTEADRLIASAVFDEYQMEMNSRRAREGTLDHADFMKAIAAHRIQARKEALADAREMAMLYADMCAGTDDPSCVGAMHAASSIAEHLGNLANEV